MTEVERRGHRPANRAHVAGATLTLLLLDNNVLIDAQRAAFDLDALIGDHDEPAAAAITIAELGVAVEITAGKRRQARRAFLADIVATLPVVDYDLDVARHTRSSSSRYARPGDLPGVDIRRPT